MTPLIHWLFSHETSAYAFWFFGGVAVALVWLILRARRPRAFIGRILEKGADGEERPVVIGPACSTEAEAEDGAWSRYVRLCGVAVTESGTRVRPDRDARCVVREVT